MQRYADRRAVVSRANDPGTFGGRSAAPVASAVAGPDGRRVACSTRSGGDGSRERQVEPVGHAGVAPAGWVHDRQPVVVVVVLGLARRREALLRHRGPQGDRPAPSWTDMTRGHGAAGQDDLSRSTTSLTGAPSPRRPRSYRLSRSAPMGARSAAAAARLAGRPERASNRSPADRPARPGSSTPSEPIPSSGEVVPAGWATWGAPLPSTPAQAVRGRRPSPAVCGRVSGHGGEGTACAGDQAPALGRGGPAAAACTQHTRDDRAPGRARDRTAGRRAPPALRRRPAGDRRAHVRHRDRRRDGRRVGRLLATTLARRGRLRDRLGGPPDPSGPRVATAAARLVAARARARRDRRTLHAYPSVHHPASNAICRRAGFALVGPTEFEYPPGQLIEVNDWRLDLHLEDPTQDRQLD